MIRFCTLFSGSSGNAVYLETDKTKILIDCGVSGRKVAASLAEIGVKAEELDAILVTHEHIDHTKSLGVVSRRYNLPIYANESTWTGIENIMGSIDEGNKIYIETGRDFYIKDILIHPFPIPHDAAEPVAYNFYADNKKITLATDIGHINDNLLSNIKGCNMLLIEANHDVEMLKCCSYPYYVKKRILGEKGHLCNEAAGELIASMAKSGTEVFLLGHLSKNNNFPQLAYNTVYNILEEQGIKVGKDILLDVAEREKTSLIGSNGKCING